VLAAVTPVIEASVRLFCRLARAAAGDRDLCEKLYITLSPLVCVVRDISHARFLPD
jgi:hypothetical protein